MTDSPTFVKTLKGKDEISSRQYHLAVKLRSALIVVDGKSSVTRLLENGIPDLLNSIKELAALGFIEPVSSATWGPASSFEPAEPVIDQAIKTELSLELVRISQQILGPGADKVIKMIQKSPDNPEALDATLRKCVEFVNLMVDEEKSKALATKYKQALAIASQKTTAG